MNDIVLELRRRACTTAENPEHDHGHTDCYLERTAADEIERLRAENKKLAAWLMHEYVFVHERILEAVDLDLVPYYGKAHGE